MHLPEIDKYAHLNSVFHSWDPRVKLVSCSLLIISLALLPGLSSASLGLAVALSLVMLSRIPFRFVLRQLKWVVLFILFFLVIMPLTVPGSEIAGMGPVTISREGVRLSALIALRALSICLIIFPMFGSAEFHRSLKALARLKVPEKLIQMIMFTYRYIFVLLGELRRMSTAARARLFKKGANVYTLKVTGNLTGMLFIRGFERTERIYNAMAARGYKGKLHNRDGFELTKRDLFKAFCLIAVGLALHFIR